MIFLVMLKHNFLQKERLRKKELKVQMSIGKS